MNILFQKDFPVQQLGKLHSDLTELETYLQITSGGYSKVRDDIQEIYAVQEIIEKLVKEHRNKPKKNDEME